MADPVSVWSRMRDSLWFVPSLIVLAAILLAVGMVELSARVSSEMLDRWPRLFGAGADGSRSMLSAIAGSMITVAGVIFSITMVAVTQASAQYTPRILRNFMRDRANQAVLGVFVGIFAYCLVVLRTIRDGEDPGFVPSLAVLVGMLLALLGIAVLIFFIHHIATTLQASEIVARIAAETSEVVDRLFPAEIEDGPPLGAAGFEAPALPWHPVPSRATGYLQRVDSARLLEVACERGLVVRLQHAVGEFVIEGQPVAWWTRDPAGGQPAAGDAGTETQAVERQLSVGTYRTLDHDAGFGIRQMVDIALKALSPGINDTTTAVTCVNYMGAILVRLVNRRIDVQHRGPDGHVRVQLAGPSFEHLLALAMDETRASARGNVAVLARQLETLAMIARSARTPSRRRSAGPHIERLREVVAATVAARDDRERLERLAVEALAAT